MYKQRGIKIGLIALFFQIAAPIYCSYALPSSSFVYPLMDPKISSGFGQRRHPAIKIVRHHDGLDLAAPKGSPIRAIKDGYVVFADRYKGYGNLVVVKHQGDFTSHYGHCEKILVKPGKFIKAGSIVATVGSTGISTGPHLHFEIRKISEGKRAGEALNPLDYIPDIAKEGEG